MRLNPAIDPGYELLHEGVIALTQMEANGIRIDVEYLDWAIENTGTRIQNLRDKIRDHEIGRAWRRKFGAKTNFGSRDQLADLLFLPKRMGGLGYIPRDSTSGGRAKADEKALERLNLPFIKGYLKLEKLIKAKGTYLSNIRREVVGDRIHPVYNLHTVITYRGSADSPSVQNMPIRDPGIGELIRNCVIASKGCVLIEHDFKGAEVGVAACYHKDPVMIEYLEDSTKDMHRDMAMQIYFLKKKEVTKEIRHSAKNDFVFPEFYGDWWHSVAQNLWENIERREFKLPDGQSLYTRLKENGIEELGSIEKDEEGNYPKPEKGTFLRHVQEVEHDFWNNRFTVYGKWKRRWFDEYVSKGYFDTLTGFRVAGSFERNQVINFPVQGSAFHCLLWSLIKIQKILRKRGMKTKLVGQIHDCLIADVPIDEVDDYTRIVHHVVEVLLREHYKWIIVPLVVETKIAPPGKTWFQQKEVKVDIHQDQIIYEFDGQMYSSAKGLFAAMNN
jgi:DNA polymerase-1